MGFVLTKTIRETFGMVFISKMAKIFLIVLVLLLCLAGFFGLYRAYEQRQARRLTRQDAKAPQNSITFVEGWNNAQIADYLAKGGIVSAATFLADERAFNASAYDFLSAKPPGADLEGFIFPDTYFIPQNPGAGQSLSDVIIIKALGDFNLRVTPQIRAQAAVNGLNFYQMVTLASIVEKETGGDQTQKKIVAGIFYNRLKAGMPLQSDATVAFATGHTDVSLADTEVNSPYNTYKNTGLPPGPICNPSLDSILAAAYPERTDYLYFLTDPKTGQAIYAKTYQEHLANKVKYLGN